MMSTLVKIASVTVGVGGAASIDFSSIPATYDDLKLVFSLRSNLAQIYGDFGIRANNDSTANQSWKFLRGNGGTASSQGTTTDTSLYATSLSGNSSTANVFASGEIYIPNYLSSNYKSASTDGVGENNAATAYAELGASLWPSTAAINRLTIICASTIMQYSMATLYGIKNS